MIIAITDKIANFVKKILDRVYQTVKETFQYIAFIVITLGAILLMLYTIAQPNFYTLILSFIIWGYNEENFYIFFLGIFLFPFMILSVVNS